MVRVCVPNTVGLSQAEFKDEALKTAADREQYYGKAPRRVVVRGYQEDSNWCWSRFTGLYLCWCLTFVVDCNSSRDALLSACQKRLSEIVTPSHDAAREAISYLTKSLPVCMYPLFWIFRRGLALINLSR